MVGLAKIPGKQLNSVLVYFEEGYLPTILINCFNSHSKRVSFSVGAFSALYTLGSRLFGLDCLYVCSTFHSFKLMCHQSCCSKAMILRCSFFFLVCACDKKSRDFSRHEVMKLSTIVSRIM